MASVGATLAFKGPNSGVLGALEPRQQTANKKQQGGRTLKSNTIAISHGPSTGIPKGPSAGCNNGAPAHRHLSRFHHSTVEKCTLLARIPGAGRGGPTPLISLHLCSPQKRVGDAIFTEGGILYRLWRPRACFPGPNIAQLYENTDRETKM